MRTIADTALPNLMRHIYPTYRVPRVSFAEAAIPVEIPQQTFCTDTTLSHGVLTLSQPDPTQTGEFVDLLHRLDNQSGLLRNLEVRVEGPVGRDSLELVLERFQHHRQQLKPVAAIPALPEAVATVEGLGLTEAGLAVGASDFLVAGDQRKEQVTRLLGTMDVCLEHAIRPRVDLLDITRADLDGFVLPVLETCLNHLAARGSSQLQLRLCDSLGLGLPWGESPIPRSVPRMVHTIRHAMGLRPDQLEFLGANDLGLALPNALSATLAGCGGIACSIGGTGERCGITPTELVLLHFSGLYGTDCDLTAVSALHTLLAPLGLALDRHHPLWGEEALTVSCLPAAAPAQELIVPLDTTRLLGRAPRIDVRPQSGAVGIVHLIHEHLPEAEVQPTDQVVRQLHDWIGQRGSSEIRWETLEPRVRELLPELFAEPTQD